MKNNFKVFGLFLAGSILCSTLYIEDGYACKRILDDISSTGAPLVKKPKLIEESKDAAASAGDEDLNQDPPVSTFRGQEKVKSFFEETWKGARDHRGAIIHLINQYSEDLFV